MKVIVKNIATEYRDEGQGNTILCLHGWQDNLQTFDLITEQLKLNYRVIRLDLPGFGNTEKPEDDWGLDQYIDFLVDFIKKINIDIYVLVGHSFGGRIAIKGVAEGKIRPEKIILIASAGINKSNSWCNRILVLVAKIGKLPFLLLGLFGLNVNYFRHWWNRLIGSDYYEAGPLNKIFLNTIKDDLKMKAKMITQPVLLLWGKEDKITPISDGQKFASLITDSHLEIISDSGHFVHRDKANIVADLISKFI